MSELHLFFQVRSAVYRNGERFLREIPVSREVFEKASKVSGLNVETLCF